MLNKSVSKTQFFTNHTDLLGRPIGQPPPPSVYISYSCTWQSANLQHFFWRIEYDETKVTKGNSHEKRQPPAPKKNAVSGCSSCINSKVDEKWELTWGAPNNRRNLKTGYICIYIYTYIHVCIYIYIYIYVCIYIYI